MADKSTPPARERKDPTVSSSSVDSTAYPDGTHPVRSASEVTHSATNIEYRDLPDDQKPDPTTVAQEQVPNPDFPNQGAGEDNK